MTVFVGPTIGLLQVLAEEAEHPLPCVVGGFLVFPESDDARQPLQRSTIGEAVSGSRVGLYVVWNVLLGQDFFEAFAAAPVERIALAEAGDDGTRTVEDVGVLALQ